MPQVLAIGYDVPLLETRVAVIRSKYETDGALVENSLSALDSKPYEVVIVCHSVPFDVATQLVRNIRNRFPSIKIVRLVAPFSPYILRPVSDKVIEASFQPEVWLAAVDQFLQLGHHSIN